MDSSICSAIHITLSTLLKIYCSSVFIFPIASVFQERRIWNPSPHLPSLSFHAHIKIYLVNAVWMALTLIGGLILLPKAMVGKLLGNGFAVQREAHFVERTTSAICTYVFLVPTVEIDGVENLPPSSEDGTSPAPVYIANHSSVIDLAVVFLLNKRLKWVSKDSVRYLPGVGLIMTLSEHIFIRRTGKNSKSVSNLYEKSNKAIQSGTPMFFFPQGTRKMDSRLPFKDGAFRIAIENESEIVPISINIPIGVWDSWYPIDLLWGRRDEKMKIVLTVHKRIRAKKGMDIEELKKKSFDAIFSVLPVFEGEESVADAKKER